MPVHRLLCRGEHRRLVDHVRLGGWQSTLTPGPGMECSGPRNQGTEFRTQKSLCREAPDENSVLSRLRLRRLQRVCLQSCERKPLKQRSSSGYKILPRPCSGACASTCLIYRNVTFAVPTFWSSSNNIATYPSTPSGNSYFRCGRRSAQPIQWKYSHPSRRIRDNEFTATGH
jgi:hypothetical protein